MNKSTQPNTNTSIQDRFVQYAQVYADSHVHMPAAVAGNSGAGSLKTALTRKERYNDKSTTQSAEGVTK